MKSLVSAAVASLALSLSVQAGQPTVDKNPKNPVAPSCFGDTELQIDTYATYANYKGDNGFGGGIALNYFFQRNIGAGVDVNVTGTDETAWTYSAHIIARYPLEFGSTCLAPYVKVAGGITDNDTTAGFFGVGGGLEFRVSPRWGIFGEGSYNWAAADEDFAQARAGLRWVF